MTFDGETGMHLRDLWLGSAEGETETRACEHVFERRQR